MIDGAYITIDSAPEAKTDDEGNAVEATEVEVAAARLAAMDTANKILADFEGGQSLEQLAEAKELPYSTTISGASTTYGEWFYSAARKAGDAEIIEDDANSKIYVALFNGRERDASLDYSVRHVLVTAENLDLPEGEEATNEQIEAKANELLASWDGTEDGFAALA